MGIQERKEREKEQRRNEIVDAAEKVFFSKGVAVATMDEIASTAELSKGTLYLYFKNKEDLHFAICVRGLTLLKEKLTSVVEPQFSVLENLVRVGMAFVKFAREHTDYFKVMSHFEGKSEEDMSCMHEHSEKDDVMQFLVQLISRGISDGTIRKEIDPAITAHVLWAQITGVLSLMSAKKLHLDANKITDDDLIRAHFEIVANGIRSDIETININDYINKT